MGCSHRDFPALAASMASLDPSTLTSPLCLTCSSTSANALNSRSEVERTSSLMDCLASSVSPVRWRSMET